MDVDVVDTSPPDGSHFDNNVFLQWNSGDGSPLHRAGNLPVLCINTITINIFHQH